MDRKDLLLVRAAADVAAAGPLEHLRRYLLGSLPEGDRALLDGALRDAWLLGYLARAHEEREAEVAAAARAAGQAVTAAPEAPPSPPRPAPAPGLWAGRRPGKGFWRRLWPW